VWPELAAFLKTFDLTKLSSAFLYYMFLILAGKCSQKIKADHKKQTQ